MGIVYFCISTPATITETDAAKSASEQDLSGRTARCCSVASLTNATWSAQEPYDHKWISGATDYQGHHGMKLLVVSHRLWGYTRFKNYCKHKEQMLSKTQVMVVFYLARKSRLCRRLLLIWAPVVAAQMRVLKFSLHPIQRPQTTGGFLTKCTGSRLPRSLSEGELSQNKKLVFSVYWSRGT